MIVRTTALADEHILAIDDWWREHRLASPDLFSDELADTFALVASAPTSVGPGPRPTCPVSAVS